MIRLLYVSQVTPGTSEEQVRDILKVSQKSNAASGITGVLLHGGGMFMQVLEGPEHTVLRKYVKILDDKRHDDCRIIHISPAEQRMFDKWSMGIINSDPLQFQHVRELKAHRLEAVQAKVFSALLYDFINTLNTNKSAA
jgi:hypothetical protein